MFCLLTMLALAAGEPSEKPLPAVKEPDWNAWKDVNLSKKEQAAEAWKILCQFRPNRKYKDESEEKQAHERPSVQISRRFTRSGLRRRR